MTEKEIGAAFRESLAENQYVRLRNELREEKYKNIYNKFLPEKIKKQNHRYWLEARTELEWVGDYSLKLKKDRENNDVYQFENELKIEILYCYEERRKVGVHKIGLSPMNITICAWAYDYGNELSSIVDKEIWTPEQKIINQFDELINSKYKELGFKSFHNRYEQGEDKFDLLTRIWPHIDMADENHIYPSSYYYFLEIAESYDLIMFLLTNVNLYRQYTSNYIGHPVDRPNLYYQMNLSIYDKRYLDFCSITLEHIYAFWERIAFLLFQFIKPITLNKADPTKYVINDDNFSLAKLIDQLKKEAKKHPPFSFLCSEQSNFEWFKRFVKNEHKKLCYERHPLIHFKIDENGVGRGGIYATTHASWLENISNKVALQALQKKNENLCGFLNDQFKQCEIGLEKAVELIIEIQTAKNQNQLP